MNAPKSGLMVLAVVLLMPLLGGADGDGGCGSKPTSDDIQQQQQEKLLQEGTSQVGMPAIKNFREKKIMKDILELRDQEGLATYTYLADEMHGKVGDFFCDSIGYAMPYATQFTNPQKAEYESNHGYVTFPQADPNGLFSPASAEGTWVLCKDPNGDSVQPIYVEPRVIVSPFKLRRESDAVQEAAKPEAPKK